MTERLNWVPIKSTTTTGGRGGGKKRKKMQKNLQKKSKHKNNKCLSWVTAVRGLSLTRSHSPPHLPGMPSNTVLISGPAVGAAQILICSCSCVFLSPTSTAVRTTAFSFVGALNDLLHIPQTQGLPSWSCGFNLQLVQLEGWFWVFFLSPTAPGFQLWFYFHLRMWVVHWGLLWRLPWRTWPSEGQVWRWCSCLGRRGSGSTRYSGELAARAAGNIVSRRAWQPVLANMLQCSCLRNCPPWQRSLANQSTRSPRVRLYQGDPACIDAKFFSCGYSAPVRAESEGSTAAWLAGTLAAPSLQQHGLPPP